MRISVPSVEVETKVEAKLKQAAGQVRLKGFRPGKVPMREVRRRFGDGIRQEVSSELMQSSFSEAVAREEVLPAGAPRIEDVSIEAGKDLEFTAIFEVFPDVTPGDLANIKVERPVAEVKDTDLDQMIEQLREQRTEYKEVGRASAQDDKINLDFEGFIDGEAFDGGKAEGSEVVIGSGSMIPGFEDGLVGLSAGDETELSVRFPDDYQAENLKGKDAVFKIKVNQVNEATLPELNDEFFQLFGVDEGGMDAFRDEVRANMEKELKAAVKNKVKTQVMDGLVAITEVELPASLISSEIDRMKQEAVQQFGGGQNIDPSILPNEMFESQAQRRVQLGLIVNAIVENKEISPDGEKVRETIEEMASSYEQPEQVVSYYYSNQQQLAQIESVVLEDQVVDAILAEADVTEVEMSYEEAIKPLPQEEAGKEPVGESEESTS